MSLKDTVKHMHDLLDHIKLDLSKAEGGNKAASQRVRTGTVRLEKVAKMYRKESIQSEKKGSHGPKKAKAHKASKAKAHKAPKAKKAVKAKSHAKPKHKSAKAAVRPRALMMKRKTAKIPLKK